MKTLLLLRHGKAERSADGGDSSRALTERGRSDSAAMGREVARIAGILDCVVTSDAKRASETAKIAAAGAGYTGEIATDPDVYAADVDTLLDIVRKLPNEHSKVMLVGHNPGFEELASALAVEGTAPISLSTAGLAHLTFDADRWKDVRAGTGKLESVTSPDDL